MAKYSVTEKPCSVCSKILPATTEYFNKKDRGINGLCSWCKKCHSERCKKPARAWSSRNPEKQSIAIQNWIKKHPEQVADYGRRGNEKWRKKYPLKHAVKEQRRRAKLKGIEGAHTYEDIIRIFEEQEHRCAYCGITLYLTIPKDFHIDHIQPISKYGSNNPDNLCLACEYCNLSKGAKTLLEWEAMRGW